MNRFVTADTHFGHRGVIRFAGKNGEPLRPWGRVDPEMSEQEMQIRVAEMDEGMVERWNAVVGPKDVVEVLGDVVINRRALPILGRLNGRKKLRMGNHDVFTKKWNADYAPYFEDITAYKVLDDLILSHIPLHPESVKERWLANVHGHLHDREVMTKRGTGMMRRVSFQAPGMREPRLSRPMTVMEDVPDPRYLCVSVEHTDYAPISFEEVYSRIYTRQAVHKVKNGL